MKRNALCPHVVFGIVPSALIIFGTTFTLFIFHNSHSRSKNIISVSLCGFSFTVISSECDTRITLTAQAKGIGARWERELHFFVDVVFINNNNNNNNTLFFVHAQCVSPLCFGESFAWSFCTTSVASNPCTQIISSLRTLFKFQVTLFDFIILFCVLAFTVFILWGCYLDREVRKTILVRHIHVCISITWSKVTDVLVTFRYFTFSK